MCHIILKIQRSYYTINKCLLQNSLTSIPIVCSPEVTIKSQTILISVLLALLLFGITVAVVIYLVVRNRKLQHDYMMLSQSVPLDSKGVSFFFKKILFGSLICFFYRRRISPLFWTLVQIYQEQFSQMKALELLFFKNRLFMIVVQRNVSNFYTL